MLLCFIVLLWYYQVLSAVGILEGISGAVDGRNIGGSNVARTIDRTQDELNAVATTGNLSDASEIVLEGSRRNSDLEVDGISGNQWDALVVGGSNRGVKPGRSAIGNLAHEFAADVGRAGEGIGGVTVTRSISSAGQSTVSGLGGVHVVKCQLNRGASRCALSSDVLKKCGLVAKQIDTMDGIEEFGSQIANKVVLNEVLVCRNISKKHKTRVHRRVGGVELEGFGPVARITEDIILDIRCRKIADIKTVSLEPEYINHISSLHVVDSDGADVKNSGGLSGKSAGHVHGHGGIKTGKSEINSHYLLVIINLNILYLWILLNILILCILRQRQRQRQLNMSFVYLYLIRRRQFNRQ